MGKKQHLSRLAAPRTWPVERKRSKWIAKPSAGAHSIKKSLPLVVVLRDILKLVKTSKDVKNLLNERAILVNNRKLTDIKFAVGLFDVISLPKIKESYRVLINKQNKFSLVKIAESEANTLLLRIDNKRTVSKGKTQINFMNGWNQLVSKGNYKTSDVVVFDTKTNKLVSTLNLKVGSIVYFIGGKHAGISGKLSELSETGTLRKHKVAKVSFGKESIESSLRNIIVIGDTKPLIKVEL
jgi:small subunit ribosomal protein S4e